MSRALPPTVTIEPMRLDHWPAVRAIHAAGISGGNATLEREPAEDWSTWSDAHRPDCRLVAVDSEGVLGWVALSPLSTRQVYAGVAWLSVYVAPDRQGHGHGRALIDAVVEASEVAGIWTLLAGFSSKMRPAWRSTSEPDFGGSASRSGSARIQREAGAMSC